MLLCDLLLTVVFFWGLCQPLNATQEQLGTLPVITQERIATLSQAVAYVTENTGCLLDVDFTLVKPTILQEIETGQCPLLAPDTLEAVRSMKEAAACIVALTARSNQLGAATLRNLQELGLSSFDHLPESKPLGSATDPSGKEDQLMYYHPGLVCANGFDKALAFLAFVEHWPDGKLTPSEWVVVDDQKPWLDCFVEVFRIEAFNKYKDRWPNATKRLANGRTLIRLLHIQTVPDIIESPVPIAVTKTQLRARGVIYHSQTADNSTAGELQQPASWFAIIKKGDSRVLKDTPFVAHTLLEALLLAFEKPYSAKANHIAIFTNDTTFAKEIRKFFESDSFIRCNPHALLRLRSAWTLTFYPLPTLSPEISDV